MAQTNFTPILLYSSSTAAAIPLAANLINSATGSEIAINIADKNLFFKDSGGTVNTVPIRQSSTSSDGWLSNTDWNTFNNKTSNLGTVTSVAATVPAFLSISGSPITTSGTLAISYSGTALPVANGGTGLTTLAAGYIPYGNGTSAFSFNSAFLYDGSGNVQIGSNGGSAKVNIWGDTALNLYNAAGTSQATISTGQVTTLANYFSTGSSLAFGTNANGAGVTERARINADGVFYIGGTTSKNNELFNVKGTAVTQSFSSNGNAALNTILDSNGVGGGLCIIRGADGYSGQSFSRTYTISVTVPGGAASTLATLIGSAGGASTTGFAFAFSVSGGYVVVTASGFTAYGGQWHVSYIGL